MLPPMRPKPIIPSCIGSSPVTRLCERSCHGVLERGQAARDVLAEMDAQDAPAAFDQNPEIAVRLRRLDDTESEFLIRYLDVGGVVAGDLEEHAGIGASLVGLSGRMKEPRPEADASSDTFAVAYQDADIL